MPTIHQLTELQAYRGSTRLRMPAGQVLVYRDHASPGVFVVLSGRLEAEDEKGLQRPCPHQAEALPGRPVVLPSPAQVNERFSHTWLVKEAADVLYLPRTLVQEDQGLRQRLVELAKG